MRPGAAPLGEQLAILIVGPPVMAGLFWLMSRGWAFSVQGGKTSEKTKGRQKIEFWMILNSYSDVRYRIRHGSLRLADLAAGRSSERPCCICGFHRGSSARPVSSRCFAPEGVGHGPPPSPNLGDFQRLVAISGKRWRFLENVGAGRGGGRESPRY